MMNNRIAALGALGVGVVAVTVRLGTDVALGLMDQRGSRPTGLSEGYAHGGYTFVDW